MDENSRRTSAFWDEAKVRAAVHGAATAKEALARLGYAQKPGNTTRLHEACRRFGLEHPSDRWKRELVERRAVVAAEAGAVWSEAELVQGMRGSGSADEVAKKMGVPATQRNIDALEAAAQRYGLELPQRRSHLRVAELTEDRIRAAVRGSASMAEVLQRLDASLAPTSYRSLRLVAERHRIALPRGHGGPSGPLRPLADLLVKDSNAKSCTLKRWLIEEGLLEEECADCRTGPVWNGKPLTLQLEHKDGDSTNNELENLELLCPNCHSQTGTWCRRKPEEVSGQRRAPREGIEPPTVR